MARRFRSGIATIALATWCFAAALPAAAQQAPATKPNIIVIWGDDIGQSNLSVYTKGVMGYQTPHIDRIASEGMLFTDYYGEQSCTAGRAAFITGQSVFRTGLSKVGMPGAKVGLQMGDPTIANLLKGQGYATGQFGKNHLGDRDEFLPTAHGFDEFYGNLYHLNAEEEPELPDYPKESDFPNFRKRFGPRGVIHSFALPDGTQKIEDTGPLTKKRMETIDDDIAARAAEFIEKQAKAGTPMFVWVNFTHMHLRTHAKPESVGQAGRWQGIYHDVMIDHDKNVGTVLAKIDELGIADNTIVLYSTDNGPHMNSWPDAGMTPFRSEKDTNWEGAYRVPAMVRWPGKIKPGTVSNEIVSHMDWMPTLLAAAGAPDVKQSLRGLQGRCHDLQGASGRLRPASLPDGAGAEEPPRQEYFYFSDDGDLTALRYDNWKTVFAQQRFRAPWRSGASRSSTPGSPGSTTCVWIPTSARRLRRTPTGTGTSITPSCSCPRRTTSRASSRASRSFRRGRRRRASRSIRCWRACKLPRPGDPA